MKKFIILALIAIMLTVTACTQYIPVFIPGEDEPSVRTITTVTELRQFLAENTSGKARITLSATPSDFPMDVNGFKDVSGNMNVEGIGTYISRTGEDEGKILFNVSDSATMNISNFTASIAATVAEEIKSVIYVDAGKLSATSFSVIVTGQSPEVSHPAGIYLGESAKAENIEIASSPVVIEINEKNDDENLIDKVEDATGAEVETPYDIHAAEDFTTILAQYGKVRLLEDITLTELPLSASSPESNVIDLNHNTLTFSTEGSMALPEGKDLRFRNGNLVTTFNPTDVAKVVFTVGKDSKFELDKVNFTAASSGILPSENAEIVVTNSQVIVDGAWGISTNASNPEGYNVSITISEGSKVESKYRTAAAVMLNTPTILTISDSTIIGGRQGVILRGGTGHFSNSTITSRGEFDPATDEYYLDGVWGSGNAIPMASLVVGNPTTTAYKYSTDCYIDDLTKLIMTNSGEYDEDKAFEIYVASINGESEYETTLTVPEDIATYIIDSKAWYGTHISINNNTLTSSDEGESTTP